MKRLGFAVLALAAASGSALLQVSCSSENDSARPSSAANAGSAGDVDATPVDAAGGNEAGAAGERGGERLAAGAGGAFEQSGAGGDSAQGGNAALGGSSALGGSAALGGSSAAGGGGARGGDSALGGGGRSATGGDSASAGGSAGGAPATYPAGPFGTGTGSVMADVCFQGLRQPAAVSYVAAGNITAVCLRDFYNPTHQVSSPRFLLIATAALWCSPCKAEEKTAQANREYWLARGVEFMTTLTEDASFSPASNKSIESWSKQFTLAFPVVLDAEKQLFPYFPSEAYPDHLLIDLSNMTIVTQASGTFDSSADSTVLKAATGS